MRSLYEQMQQWYNSPLGRLLLEAESKGLQSFLEEIFGYYLLQLGGPQQVELLNASSIGKKIYYDMELINDRHKTIMQGKFTELPFLLDSIDLIVAPHVLELADQPRKILSEIYHILIPEGHVIIMGFNPISLWGLVRLFKRHNTIPWGNKFISVARMRRWLSKIGFEVVKHKTFFFRPPLLNKGTLFMEGMGQVLWPGCGAFYIMVAKKSVMSLTPIKQERRLVKQPVAVPSSYAKPTTRIQNEEG